MADTSIAGKSTVQHNAQAQTSASWERGLLEKAVLAAVREQRAARRWKIFFRLAFLFISGVVAWRMLVILGEPVIVGGGKHTALVTLEGEITAHGRASAVNLKAALDDAFAADSTAGVILQINSPGGSPVQAGIINDEIRRLRKRYPDKPLYAVVEDICASGAYYIAVAADRIFVDKASIIGSIGVRLDGFGFTKLMEKLGIERRLLTAGRNKALGDPFLPRDNQQEQHMQALLDQVHQQFIDVVRQGRGKRLKETPEIFSGLIWTGQQGVELGLADDFGDVDHVARNVLKAEDIVDYTVQEGFIERARRLGLSFGAGLTRALVAEKPLQLH